MSEELKQKILVIDDDVTIRKLLTHNLSKNNYSVFAVENPSEGFEKLNNEEIDLVLCDVSMEGMNGFEFCKKVRENEKFRFIPFIFVTAKSSLEDKTQALDAGGDDMVAKPFNFPDLLIKIKSLLKRASIYKTYSIKKNLEESFSTAKSRILLVDDDQTITKLFQYNLTRAGFECITASNGVEALKLAEKTIPDVIISDIMMPEMNGFEFRKKILENEKLKSIPFIFLTAKGEETDILEGYDLGITDYMIKTAGPRVVIAKVSAIINSLGKERQKAVSELHQAADSLRAKVVPDNYPEFPGYQIVHWHQPFQGIPGGDFIDYFLLDENNLAIILGDVMGKKWGAWYFAFAYAGYVRSSIRVALQTSEEYSPGQILQQVNKSVYKDAKVSEVFATLSIITIDKTKNILKYSGAGDLPIIYKNKSSGKIEQFKSKGLLLGFAENGLYEDIAINVSSGDIVLMVTDGIIESRNKEGNQFGSKNLSSVLEKLDDNANVIEEIKKEFELFTSKKFEDDISLISIKVK